MELKFHLDIIMDADQNFMTRLEAIETSLAHIKSLIETHFLNQPAVTKDRADANESSFHAGSGSPEHAGSDVFVGSPHNIQGSPESSTATTSPAMEIVRAAPISIVREMKHRILGTNHRNIRLADVGTEDPISLGIITAPLCNMLVQR